MYKGLKSCIWVVQSANADLMTGRQVIWKGAAIHPFNTRASKDTFSRSCLEKAPHLIFVSRHAERIHSSKEYTFEIAFDKNDVLRFPLSIFMYTHSESHLIANLPLVIGESICNVAILSNI